MPRFQIGQEILPGDYILYAGEPCRVEFVATAGDPETGWCVEHHGSSCMIVTASGVRIYLNDTEDEEDLKFVSRGTRPSTTP